MANADLENVSGAMAIAAMAIAAMTTAAMATVAVEIFAMAIVAAALSLLRHLWHSIVTAYDLQSLLVNLTQSAPQMW